MVTLQYSVLETWYLYYKGRSESRTDLRQSWAWRYKQTQGVQVRRGRGQRPEKQMDMGQGGEQTPSEKQDGLALLGENRQRHVGCSSVQRQRTGTEHRHGAQAQRTGTEPEPDVVHQQRVLEKLCQGQALTSSLHVSKQDMSLLCSSSCYLHGFLTCGLLPLLLPSLLQLS
jgi:hypothetical protein